MAISGTGFYRLDVFPIQQCQSTEGNMFMLPTTLSVLGDTRVLSCYNDSAKYCLPCVIIVVHNSSFDS